MAEKAQMMAKIALLQKQSYEQSLMLQRLWGQVQAERRANAALKMETSRMAAAMEMARASMARQSHCHFRAPCPLDTVSFSAVSPAQSPVDSAPSAEPTTSSDDSWDDSVYDIVDRVISEGQSAVPHQNDNFFSYAPAAAACGSEAVRASQQKPIGC